MEHPDEAWDDAEAGPPPEAEAQMARTAGPWMSGPGGDGPRRGPGARVPPLRASASSPGTLNLASTTSSARMSQRSRKSATSIPSSPFRVRPPFKYPDFDLMTGVKLKLADHHTDWDERHQLLLNPRGDPMADNAQLPRGVRKYFSEKHNVEDVKAHLTSLLSTPTGSAPGSTAKTVLRTLNGEKTPRKTLQHLTADCGPPLLPMRHTLGGGMRDVDGMVRPWNDRWNRGIQQMNDELHKSHRQYFVQQSVYKVSKSQDWRRYNEMQVAPGKWIPIATIKPSGPIPLGV
mmetsp:Transcript_2836/g.5742  ORF Transcript_2836/g.5742 Transcript_2836/m.5742 type:complete len:289 (+) Transcript_2836:114-980(+)